MTAQTRSEIKALLEAHGLAPTHRLGQHFLADANITRKIVSAADVSSGDKVVEVGAGTGTLTAALADAGASVVAYEVDEGLLPVLEEVTSGMDVDIRIADATQVDLSADLVGGPWKMVANLPYNVGTPVVLDAIRQATSISMFVVMVQNEVAERFVAGSGGRDYGIPSVIAQIHTEATLAFRVPPQVFYPAPRVGSAVVVMRRKPAPAFAEAGIEIASVAFGQRRKMLRRSLAGVFDEPSVVLEAAGIEPTLRAEDLAPSQFLDLAAAAS